MRIVSPEDQQKTPEQPAGKTPESTAKKAEEKAEEKIDLPKVSFSTFVLSLASSALAQLGEVPNPETGKTEVNLDMAYHSIELLAMLSDKTKHGLDKDETKLIDGLLYELRMKYVLKKQ